jgi:hypothetical protein
MGRIRTVKPELFKHGELFDAEQESGLPLRLAFIALFTCCDREGRFKWRPRELKVDCLPHDTVDFSRVLDALATRGFVVRYADTAGVEYGCIPSFGRHQVINNREKDSELPSPTGTGVVTREARVDHATTTRTQGKGREGKGREQEGKGTEQVCEVSIWPTFDDWWTLYDKKADRKKCEAKWDRMDQPTREAIMEHTRIYVTQGRGTDRQFRRDPSTYLNNENWNDEALTTPRNDNARPADQLPSEKYARLLRLAQASDTGPAV